MHYHLKKDFHSNLNLENISDEDYVHIQKVWDIFKIKNLGEYHNLYVKIDTLLLADIFEDLEICVLIYMNLIQHILYLHLD